MFRRFTEKKARRQRAQELYDRIVAQSRQPYFYADLAVPDSVAGRFEILALHMFLVLTRLRWKADADPDRAQDLVDLFFLDMDTVNRELGVGDLAVPKRMKRLAAGFYGRLSAYEDALGAEKNTDLPDDPLAVALLRNVYGIADPGTATENQAHMAKQLARYVRTCHDWQKRQSLAALDQGPLFPPDAISPI